MIQPYPLDMRTLYVKTGCPYCARVLKAANDLAIPLSLKNVADEGVAEELVRLGGKLQTPFLVDDEHGTMLYESDVIEQYLRDAAAWPGASD